MGYEKPLTGAQRVAKRRAALRAQGLKPRTFWLPDVNSAAFREEVARDVEWLWEKVPDEIEAMAFIDAMVEEVFADLDRAEAER